MYLSPHRISALCDLFYRGLKAAERLEHDPDDAEARAELRSILRRRPDEDQDSARISAALEEADSVVHAAELLGMPASTLYERVAALGLQTPAQRKRRCGPQPRRRQPKLLEAA